MTLKQAVEAYEKKYPAQKVAAVLDVGDEWVFSAADRESGLTPSVSPTAVNKEDGTMRIFFPPANMEKLKHAVTVHMDRMED